jgi:hypothetical protein
MPRPPDQRKLKAAYDKHKAVYEGGTWEAHRKARAKAFNERESVDETLRLIQVAVVQGEARAARDIQAEALAILDDPRLRDAVPKER